MLGARGFRDEPTILCTGGFGASSELVTRYIAPAASLRLRANPWSTGDGLAAAVERGGALSGGMDEFYGRNMPDAAWDESEFVSASQLYGRYARIFDRGRHRVLPSRGCVVVGDQRRAGDCAPPGARAFYLLDDEALSRPLRDRTVAEVVGAAPSEARVAPADLPFEPPAGTLEAVRVIASITHTVGGLRVDQQARVVRPDGVPVDGLWAAGVDVGGLATGGYASGLAQALVLGLVAAESV